MAEKNEVKFVFKPAGTNAVTWPCRIAVPVDGGGFQTQIVTARFEVLSDEEYLALLDAKGARGVLDRAILCFEGLHYGEGPESGKPVPLADAKAGLFALPYAVNGLLAGYTEMIGRRLSKN